MCDYTCLLCVWKSLASSSEVFCKGYVCIFNEERDNKKGVTEENDVKKMDM